MAQFCADKKQQVFDSMRKKYSLGFSLIELSIVIIVAGLMMSSFLSMWKVRTAGVDLAVTKENLHRAEIALKSFVEMNGSYPCPASRDARKPDIDFGRAVSVCGDPKETESDVKGVAVASGRDELEVKIGILPFRSLGIPDAYAVDGWGNLLQYAVTGNLTNPDSFNQRGGAIDVIAGDSQSRLIPPGTAQYVVFSTGADGAGGYSMNGVTLSACPDGVPQTKNCDDDAVFIDTESQIVAAEKETKLFRIHKKPAGTVGYDDRIVYLQYDPDMKVNAGLIFYYYGSCMQGFAEVKIKDDTQPTDIETLNKFPPSDPRFTKEINQKAVLCLSSRYSVKMNVQGNDNKTNCPLGWDNIGFRRFPMGIKNEICAK